MDFETVKLQSSAYLYGGSTIEISGTDFEINTKGSVCCNLMRTKKHIFLVSIYRFQYNLNFNVGFIQIRVYIAALKVV